jgi:hypothetical protein
MYVRRASTAGRRYRQRVEVEADSQVRRDLYADAEQIAATIEPAPHEEHPPLLQEAADPKAIRRSVRARPFT